MFEKNSVVKRTRIERIERISFNLVVPLEIGFNSDCICVYTTLDRLLQEMIRDNHSAWQAQKIQQHTIFFLFFLYFSLLIFSVQNNFDYLLIKRKKPKQAGEKQNKKRLTMLSKSDTEAFATQYHSYYTAKA